MSEPRKDHSKTGLSWLVRIPRHGSERWLAMLRGNISAELLLTGGDAGEESPWIWLRGRGELVAPELFAIPGAEHFQMHASGPPIPIGGKVPSVEQPEGRWVPIKDWVHVTLPIAGLEGKVKGVPVRLVPANAVRPPSLLLCELSDFTEFVLHSTVLRLRDLEFAATREGKLLCRGTPLPSVQGEYWWAEHGLALPAGWTWQPAVDSAVLFESLSTTYVSSYEDGSYDGQFMFLLYPDGRIDVIEADAWCPSTYAAVRATEEAIS